MELIGTVHKQDRKIRVEQLDGHRFRVEVEDRVFEVDCREPAPDLYSLLHGDCSYEIRVRRHPKSDKIDTHFFRETIEVEMSDPLKRLLAEAGGPGRKGEAVLESPMPGLIQRLLVKEGDTVAEDQGLIVLVAMKMENELGSPVAGKVKEILVKDGDNVESGAPLIVIGS